MEFQTFDHNDRFIDHLRHFITFFNETDFLVLLIFAVVSKHVADQLFSKCPWRGAAKYLAIPFALVYGIHLLHENDFQNDVGVTLAILSRWLISTCVVVNCITTPIVFGAHLAVRYSQREWDAIEKYSRDLQDWYRANQKPATQPLPAPTPPVTRESIIHKSSAQAKLDYDFECEIINNAGLADEERDAALEQAKQKYLNRLNTVLQ